MKVLTSIAFTILISQVGCTFAKPPVKTTHKFEPEMQFIKGGYIILDRTQPTTVKNNKVKVKSFWMAKTETSYKEWENCFKDGGCKEDKHLPNDVYDARTRSYYSNRPVAYVNWYEANEYTRWLSKISGKRYRLPTEAEWLLAAQAGKKSRFPWGEKLTEIDKCTVCNFNGGSYLAHVKDTKPYGGLYYMYGNVAEWTCSLGVDENKYPSGDENICLTPTTYSSGYINIKGGSYEKSGFGEAYTQWPDGTLDLRVKNLSEKMGWVGFRVIREE